jgi:hypothetical protein
MALVQLDPADVPVPLATLAKNGVLGCWCQGWSLWNGFRIKVKSAKRIIYMVRDAQGISALNGCLMGANPGHTAH